MLTYSAVRNKRPNSLHVVQKLSGWSIKNKEKFSICQMGMGDVSTQEFKRIQCVMLHSDILCYSIPVCVCVCVMNMVYRTMHRCVHSCTSTLVKTV